MIIGFDDDDDGGSVFTGAVFAAVLFLKYTETKKYHLIKFSGKRLHQIIEWKEIGQTLAPR